MAAGDFTFKSPGVFIREVDRSEVPAQPVDVGPVVIGRTSRGPGLFPTVVRNLSDFRQTFGAATAGGDSNGDVWRDGSLYETTYGALAAEKYLAAKGDGPLTFVRLLGDNDPTKENAADAGGAGWEATNAFGIFLFASSSTGDLTGSLAGVVYTTNAATSVEIVDPDTSTLSGSNALIATDGATVKVKITPSVGSVETFDVNLSDRSSDVFARKVINTNPEKTNSAIFTTTKEYWLGETFEDFVGDTANLPNIKFAAVYDLKSGSIDHAARKRSLAEPVTPWFVSQDLSADSGSFNILDGNRARKLFRLVGIQQSGIQLQRDFKVAIENVNFATTTDEDEFGTFDIAVYRTVASPGGYRENDAAIARYSNLNLDKTSDNYVARRLGDSYYIWDDDEERYVERGQFPLTNPYFRVEASEALDAGDIPQEALPFGYVGGLKYVNQTFVSGSSTAVTTVLTSSGLGAVPTGFVDNGGLDGAEVYVSDGTYNDFDFTAAGFSVLINFPTIETIAGPVRTPSSTRYFGVDTARTNKSYYDSVRQLSSDLTDLYDPTTGEPVEYAFVFTLDDVQQGTGSVASTTANQRTTGKGYEKAVYVAGSRAAGSSITSLGGWYTGSSADPGASALYSGSYKAILRKNSERGPELNRFIAPFYGGSDGLNLVEPAPFANRILSGQNEISSYAFYSIDKAIKTIADPEALEFDAIAIPGLTNNTLQNTLIETVEARGDALAMIDLEHDYLPNTETAAAATITSPSLREAIQKMQTRQLNSNYAAAFYPSVRMAVGSSNVVVPPTVAMLGVFGQTAREAQPWFAPAGFSRGGLNALGVSKAVLTLRSSERDDLYENNVNPIAQFPVEGPVVFGQKTLQQRSSALDRINVRRLLIYLKRQVDFVARTVLFEGNTEQTRRSFTNRITTIMQAVKAQGGLTDYRVLIGRDAVGTDEEFNELTDRNALYGRVLVQPTRAIEFIALDFEILRTGDALE